jgi:hypothetical protein
MGNFLIIRLPNYDKSREHVESEGYITLNHTITNTRRVIRERQTARDEGVKLTILYKTGHACFYLLNNNFKK